MAEPARYATPFGRPEQRIFISYRRADAEADANALCQSLEAAFGDAAIFRDVDNITVGLDYRDAIVSAIDDSAALVLVIGPQWLAKDARGRLRLSRESDPTRLEIEHARARGVPILPIRMRGAEMPEPEELPAELAWLSYVNAWEVQHHSWRRDLKPIVEHLRGLLGQPARTVTPPDEPEVPDGAGGGGPREQPRGRRRAERRVLAGIAIVVLAAVAIGLWAVLGSGGNGGGGTGDNDRLLNAAVRVLHVRPDVSRAEYLRDSRDAGRLNDAGFVATAMFDIRGLKDRNVDVQWSAGAQQGTKCGRRHYSRPVAVRRTTLSVPRDVRRPVRVWFPAPPEPGTYCVSIALFTEETGTLNFGTRVFRVPKVAPDRPEVPPVRQRRQPRPPARRRGRSGRNPLAALCRRLLRAEPRARLADRPRRVRGGDLRRRPGAGAGRRGRSGRRLPPRGRALPRHSPEDELQGEWHLDERRVVEERYLAAKEALAGLRLEAGELSVAIALGEDVLRTDPCRESAHRLLMRCFALQQQGQLVARQFRRCGEALGRELGLRPAGETRRLYQELTGAAGPS